MMSVEEQKQLDSNMKRVGMFHALRKMNVFVQEVENEKRLEAKAIKIALVIFGVIGVVTLIYLLMGSSRAKSPHVASEHFTNYANVLTMQVQAKLGKSCINLIETGSQSAGAILAISIMKDGAVEKVIVTKSSGDMEFDEAAVRGVLGAAPFAPFPPEIKQDADILTISPTFRREPCS